MRVTRSCNMFPGMAGREMATRRGRGEVDTEREVMARGRGKGKR